MPSIDVWVTVVIGVTDTTAKDFHRAQTVFASVPLNIKLAKHTLSRSQTQAILGTDGKLAIAAARRSSTTTCRQAREATWSAP
jgi:hypothetical protein